MSGQSLNFDACTSYFGDSHVVMLAALQQMLEVLPQDWVALKADLDVGRYHQAAIIAHRLAGTLAMVGADSMSSECRALSLQLDDNQPVDRRYVLSVEAGIMGVMAQIHTYLRQQ